MFIVLLSGVFSVFAQKTAMKVLDDAAASFKKAGGVKVAYTYSMNGQLGSGTIMMLGQTLANMWYGSTERPCGRW